MKKNVTIEEIISLTEGQKQKLRDLWLPKKYDLAAAFICKDAETEEYDSIEFIVGEVDFKEITTDKKQGISKSPTRVYEYHTITLRSLKLLNDSIYQDTPESDDSEGIEPNDSEGEFNFEYCPPDDYFSMEYCLPLFNIGQMIELLLDRKYEMSDFYINISTNNGSCSIGKSATTLDEDEKVFEGNELCDTLWSAVKSLL